MNSNEPLMENASEYWKIIDNLRDSNEKLEKELIQLKSLIADSSLEAIPDANCPTTLQTNCNLLLDYNFTLIINQLNTIVYADKNGLKLWDAISLDMIPKVNFKANQQFSSHERTKSTFLVLPDNRFIDVSIEEFDIYSTSFSSQDMLFLIKPILHSSKDQLVDHNYKELVDNSHDLIFVVQQNKLLFVNRNTLETIGFSYEELEKFG